MTEKKTKKREKAFLFVALFALVGVLALGTAAYAWLAGSGTVPSDLMSGSILTQYFHCGDGSENNPFVITRPVHYYNLVNLYQRKEGFADQGYHFQLGFDLRKDGTFCFYNYDDDGKIVTTLGSQYSDALNLACYSGDNALLPIGTSEVPFSGYFDGKGLTVANLTVKASDTVNSKTFATCDVGAFGYVGPTQRKDENGDPIDGSFVTDGGGNVLAGKIQDVYFENITVDLSEADPTAICKGTATLHDGDKTVDGQEIVYVGYIAGHITTATSISNVYVNESTIVGGYGARSSFGFFGCVEDKDTGEMAEEIGSQVGTLWTSGDNAGFGGSINMKGIYDRLKDIFDNRATQPTTYPSVVTVKVDEKDGSRVEEVVETASMTFPRSGTTTYRYKYYYTPDAGEFIYYWYDNGNAYNCIVGTDARYPQDVTTITYYDEYYEDMFYLSQGGYYLTWDGSALTGAVSLSDATPWGFDAAGHLFTTVLYGKDKFGDAAGLGPYYLNRDASNGLYISGTGITVWSRTASDELACDVDGVTYYLANLGGLGLTSYHEYYTVNDGAGHYLAFNGTKITNAGSATGALPFFDDGTLTGNKVKLMTVYNGATRYLNCDGTLYLGASGEAATEWTKDGSKLYTTIAGVRFDLHYDAGAGTWKVDPAGGYHLGDGAGHYLSVGGTGFVNSQDTQATVWFLSNPGGNTQIDTVLDGQKQYLSVVNGLLSMSTTAATWTKDGNNYYLHDAASGLDYYLTYENGAWGAYPSEYCLISAGTHYLRARGPNAFTDTTNEEEATHFYLNVSGLTVTVYYYANGLLCYVGRGNGTAFESTPTAWNMDGAGHFYVDGSASDRYYFTYDGGWIIQRCPTATAYKIKLGDNYLSLNDSGPELTTEASEAEASFWYFSNTGTTPSGTLWTTNASGTKYYVSITTSGGGCSATSYHLTVGSTDLRDASYWTITPNGRLQNKEYENYYLSSTTTVNTTGTTVTVTQAATAPTALINAENRNLTKTSISAASFAPTSAAVISGPSTASYAIGFSDFGAPIRHASATVKEDQPGGYRSYFPIRTKATDEEGYSASDPYAASGKNTGYIISAAYVDKDSTAENQRYAGDIRISRFSIKDNIGVSYTSNADSFKKIQTCDDGGIHEYTANSEAYQLAAEQLLNTLKGETYVYGLHFMDSSITKDHLVYAERATVLGRTYENYELPEDAIDFNVLQRGTINFFAGAYFSNNNAFFSLHQIYRDKDQHITEIKEISEIYAHATLGAAKPYIYKYTDGTYTLADGSYNGIRTLDDDYNSTPIFKMSWVTKPAGMTVEKVLYYYEIPCNAGEYALGSVSGGTGGYLQYLDIAANGGDMIDSVISEEGNGVIDTFQVEYRTADDVVDWTKKNSVLLYSLTFVNDKGEKIDPADIDPSKYSVKVGFTSDVSKEAYGADFFSSGLYTITIENKSGYDMQLYVLLCDDDRNAGTPFSYAYRLVYTNATETKTTMMAGAYDFRKSVGGFRIPASGAAEESVGKTTG